jgi:hypothetical protein
MTKIVQVAKQYSANTQDINLGYLTPKTGI